MIRANSLLSYTADTPSIMRYCFKPNCKCILINRKPIKTQIKLFSSHIPIQPVIPSKRKSNSKFGVVLPISGFLTILGAGSYILYKNGGDKWIDKQLPWFSQLINQVNSSIKNITEVPYDYIKQLTTKNPTSSEKHYEPTYSETESINSKQNNSFKYTEKDNSTNRQQEEQISSLSENKTKSEIEFNSVSTTIQVLKDDATLENYQTLLSPSTETNELADTNFSKVIIISNEDSIEGSEFRTKPLALAEKEELSKDIQTLSNSTSKSSVEPLIPPQVQSGIDVDRQVNEFKQNFEEKVKKDIEETVSSVYPIIYTETEQEKEQKQYEKEKELMDDVINIFWLTKDKFLQHLHLQRKEMTEVISKPENDLARKSLEGLEGEYYSLLATYKNSKNDVFESLDNLQSFKKNLEVIEDTRGQIESGVNEVSQQILNLKIHQEALNEALTLQIKDTESKQMFTRKITDLSGQIESLESELVTLKKKDTKRTLVMEKRYKEMLGAVEDETKRIIYQMIASHHDHMSNRLSEQAEELHETMEYKLRDVLQNISAEQQLNSAQLLAKLEGIDKGLNASQKGIKEIKSFQLVRNLIDELFEFIDQPSRGKPNKIFIKHRIESLQQYLSESTPLLEVLNHIPKTVLIHGLPSKQCLNEQFNKIEKTCLKLAYVHPGDGLLSYIVSYLRSWVPFQSSPKFDILRDNKNKYYDNVTMVKCARQCIDKGELYNAARILNNLRGVAREEATGWVRDARSYLETQQAIEILYWYIVTVTLTTASNI